MSAAATKTEVRKLAVNSAVHGQHWVDKNGGRRAVLQVAARMFVSGVKLNRGDVHRLRLVFSWPHAKLFACLARILRGRHQLNALQKEVAE